MKFNEKLIELRKKAGLSQEELGYKLNVTRQTVSKWELAQTTPEMDKLVEMSKIFNVSVDDLLNEREVIQNQDPIIENQPINERKPKSNKTVLIIVAVIIIIFIVMTVSAFSGINKFANKIFGIFDKTVEQQEEIQNGVFDIFNNIVDEAENQIEQMDKEDKENELDKKVEKNIFNLTFEFYNGSNSSTRVKELLDTVITNNKKEERKITLKYGESETQDTEEIKNIKLKIKDSNEFEVSFDYDEEGYINKVTIERFISEHEISSFNNTLEMYSGKEIGNSVIWAIDKIITSNKTEERKITIKYGGTETQDETEINKIKQKIGTFKYYNISYEYDADGFINKATIENM